MPKTASKPQEAEGYKGILLHSHQEEATLPASYLILLPLELETINFCYFKPPMSWCFVMAALGNEYRLYYIKFQYHVSFLTIIEKEKGQHFTSLNTEMTKHLLESIILQIICTLPRTALYTSIANIL